MSTPNLNALCYIHEQTSFTEDYGDQFGYEVHDRGNRFYLTFEAVLQSFGVKNRNRRMYDAANVMDRIENDDQIQSMLRQNSWMGEIDHPAPTKQGEELTMQRISNPDLKLTSHYVRKPHLEDNLLVANIQTDSGTEHGMNMAIKIVDGKIIPCFSARVLGELQNKRGMPLVFVKKLICYDWVLYPSHPEAMARINQPMMESVEGSVENYDNCTIIYLGELARMAAHSSKETEWLCESFGLSIEDVVGVTSTGNSVVIKEGANTYIQPLSDKIVRQKTRSIITDWFNK